MSEPATVDVANTTVPFDRALADEVQRLVGRLDAAQRAWLSGYLLGTLNAASAPTAVAAPDARPVATILYGSQSGNCESLAKRLADALTAMGVSSLALDMLDCRKTHLEEAQHLLVIVSTHGEGDPPDRARPLYDLLHGRKGPKLAHLKYAVLALGDSSYEKFCETGRRFDAQLETLGAQRLRDRVECDVDFQQAADEWIATTVSRLASRPVDSASVTPVARTSASVATAYTRKNPWQAPVLANIRLTARDSTKDVRHIELSIEGAGIHYEPGDAFGVVPRNHAAEVDSLLELLPFDAETPVTVNGADSSLRSALLEHFDIGLLNRSLVERYASLTKQSKLPETSLQGLHLIDLIAGYPLRDVGVADFVQILRPLAPRLYSVASSPKATPDEVHLTVRIVNYESNGRGRRGVVSSLLGEATDADARIAIYPHRNAAFRLPANPEAPIVMIGPGTGVAPFRAFLAERETLGARGRNWLFFGDRTLRSDFLYQTEWLDWRRRGVLHRLDVAFSRDGGDKVYVQQRIREQGADLYAWLRDGAHIYVCGDAQQMAPDVHAALHEVVRTHGALDAEAADEFLLTLQRERRYQKDVY
ncbi:MAG TPA: assimilatory sulfite reductase (NADPH) flavoprotein subunit [Povalibacter sp.]|uniref:assimilatory sulfite reductase (NADPH) flavoprotein subunit n=1 Tax=Povalibacter sp. TaxID=1962978 RepID=UPI002C9EC288|nr:assimilatory sulfite reductase (NADPH) flavoprotein subunit [Povalibacter sp.]HMN46757.1 assimilatory sulfite reductase (NADPH) flavoprotein subunit [Povalibacter sp.]